MGGEWQGLWACHDGLEAGRIFLDVLDLKWSGHAVQVLGISQALFINIRNCLGDLTLSEVTHPTKENDVLSSDSGVSQKFMHGLRVLIVWRSIEPPIIPTSMKVCDFSNWPSVRTNWSEDKNLERNGCS